MINRIIVSGFGGQGVILIGKILGVCGYEQGFFSTVLPTYGVEQRGGTANTTVVLSDAKIASPVADNPDVLIALNQPSVDKYLPTVKKGGCIIANTSQVNTESIDRDDICILQVAADDLAQEIGLAKVANILMLSAYAGYSGIITYETLEKVVLSNLAKKPEFIPLNKEALKRGYELGIRASED